MQNTYLISVKETVWKTNSETYTIYETLRNHGWKMAVFCDVALCSLVETGRDDVGCKQMRNDGKFLPAATSRNTAIFTLLAVRTCSITNWNLLNGIESWPYKFFFQVANMVALLHCCIFFENLLRLSWHGRNLSYDSMTQVHLSAMMALHIMEHWNVRF